MAFMKMIFIADFNERYYQQFQGEKNKQMATELYLTILYRPEISRLTKIFKSKANRDPVALKSRLSGISIFWMM